MIFKSRKVRVPSANWVVSSECQTELMARHDAQFSYGESSLSGRSMLDFSDVSRAAAKNVVVEAKLLSSARPRARCNAVNRPPSRAPAGRAHRRTP